MRYAITRDLGPSIDRCELTHKVRQPIDVDRAREQHGAYRSLLGSLGIAVLHLPDDPLLPDGLFVEDTALVVDELAVLMRPGAESRRGEVESVGHVLQRYRGMARIEAPATLDGGDVLRMGRKVWVGLSQRSNREGAEQLQRVLGPLGYEVRSVPVEGVLHLKSSVTAVGPETLVYDPQRIAAETFAGFPLIPCHPDEPEGANCLWLESVVAVPESAPRTRERLEAEGIRTTVLAQDELAKAEAGLTCCSILFEA